jgi:ATP-dependent helicase/DNAse subunit B
LAENNIAVVSRRPFEKYKQWPFELLTRNEAALLVGAEQKNKAAALCKINGIDGVSPAALVYEAAAALNSARTLTPFDGVVRPGNALASQLKERGISPSDLMVFLKCPARYLFGKITGGDEESFERAAVSPRRRGTFYHEILESFYKHLKTRGLFDKLSPAGAAQMLKDFLQTALSWQDYKKYGLYPLVWQVLREEFGAYLEHFAEEDFKLLEGGAFVPELFEESFETQITLNSKTLKLRGKLDRVDISGDGKSYRIIDYKTKRESAEIKKAVFRKAALQPPLYFEMAKNHPALKEKTPVAACLFGIETLGAINKDLPYDVYLALRPHFIQMLEYILEMIDDGVFLITPGENNCPGCRFETACRKAHHPTLRRSKTAGAAKKLGEYRAKY